MLPTNITNAGTTNATRMPHIVRLNNSPDDCASTTMNHTHGDGPKKNRRHPLTAIRRRSISTPRSITDGGTPSHRRHHGFSLRNLVPDAMTEPNATDTDASGPQPTCKRHRDRETGLRCTRCGTPTCWECLTPAAVGSHCPDCINEGKKGAPRHREIPWRRQATATQAVTATIIVVCVAVFILQQGSTSITLRFADVGVLVHDGEWYRLITSMFLHHDLIHLAMNMYVLWIYGQNLERREGRARFAIAYLASGIAGSVASYLFVSGFAISVGASGGVFGLLGVSLVRARQHNDDMRPLLTILGINLALPLLLPQINVAAHLGGLVAGGIYAIAARDSQRGWQQWTGAAMVSVLALAGIAGTVFIQPPTPGF